MAPLDWQEIMAGLQAGNVIPYLGPGVLQDVKHPVDGSAIPADGEALIMAMTGGQRLSPRLMTEFPRAAMHYELSKGRKFLMNFLTNTYGKTAWVGGALHEALAALGVPFIIDVNRDLRMQQLWATRPHTLIVGIARLTASWYRYKIWEYDGASYAEVSPETLNPDLPVLFKPLGTPHPEPTYVASDADYVDYITELMGGFAIPTFVKQRRQGKQYLVAGLRLTRDTQRMVLTDMIVDAAQPAGWVLIPEPTAKERRYCATQNLTVVEAGIPELLAAIDGFRNSAAAASALLVASAR